MTLTNTTATDTGYYRCELTNDVIKAYWYLPIRDRLFQKKFVYFFGSYLFHFDSLDISCVLLKI